MSGRRVALLARRADTTSAALTWLGDAGCSVVVYADDRIALPAESAPGAVHRFADWKVNGDVDRQLARDGRSEPFDAIVALSECDQVRAAELREWLGIPGQRPASAIAYRDKHAMKTLARVAGLDVPEHRLVGSPPEILDAIGRWGAAVVKPLDGAGTQGVAVLRTRGDALAWCRAQDRRADALPDLLAEEVIDAGMLSVDGVMADGKVLAAMVGRYTETCLASVRDGVAHGILTLPSADPVAVTALGEVARLVHALPGCGDIRSFHAEYFEVPGRGLMLCEVACRTGGGRLAEIAERQIGVHLDRTACLGQAGLVTADEIVGRAPAPAGHLFGDVLVPRPGGPVAMRRGGPPPVALVDHRFAADLDGPRATKISEYVADGLLCAESHHDLQGGFVEAVAWLSDRLGIQAS